MSLCGLLKKIVFLCGGSILFSFVIVLFHCRPSLSPSVFVRDGAFYRSVLLSILFDLYHDFYKRYVSGFFIDMYHCFCDSSVLLILWSHRSIHCIVRAYGIILSMPHIHVTVLMGERGTGSSECDCFCFCPRKIPKFNLIIYYSPDGCSVLPQPHS